MSIHKKGRRQARKLNNHLAKIGRPGFMKKLSSEKAESKRMTLLRRKQERQQRGAKF